MKVIIYHVTKQDLFALMFAADVGKTLLYALTSDEASDFLLFAVQDFG